QALPLAIRFYGLPLLAHLFARTCQHQPGAAMLRVAIENYLQRLRRHGKTPFEEEDAAQIDERFRIQRVDAQNALQFVFGLVELAGRQPPEDGPAHTGETIERIGLERVIETTPGFDKVKISQARNKTKRSMSIRRGVVQFQGSPGGKAC